MKLFSKKMKNHFYDFSGKLNSIRVNQIKEYLNDHNNRNSIVHSNTNDSIQDRRFNINK